MPYYAVANGRNCGVYNNWNDCKDQVHQYSGAVFKKFDTPSEAQNFISQRSSTPSSYSSSSSSSYGNASSSYNTSRYSSSSYSDDYSYGSYSSPQRTATRTYSTDRQNKLSDKGFNVDDEGYVNVYTDGACASNGRTGAKAGIGVWFGENHPCNISKPLEGRPTNNHAEIKAVTEAARKARAEGVTDLRINTDSRFVIQCKNEWLPRWKANGWKTADNKPVINKEELIEMEKALADIPNVSWNHVRGHAGVHGNEMADKLARAACEE